MGGSLAQPKKTKFNFAYIFAGPLLDTSVSPPVDIQRLDSHTEYTIIKEQLQRSKQGIRLTKKHGTSTNFSDIIDKKPDILHFSGHGKRDCLLLEREDTHAHALMQCYIKDMLDYRGFQLEFVFIGACYSESVSKVFMDSGTKHVIAVDKNKTIEDEQCLLFTKTFYNRLFQPGSRICDAFKQAEKDVMIHSCITSKDSRFKLICKDEHDPADCPVFGNYPQGQPSFVEPKTYLLKSMPPNILIEGRSKEQGTLLSKLLSRQQDTQSRLVTLTGFTGIGKSALAAATLHYIQERALFSGGCIYIDARQTATRRQFIEKLTTLIHADIRPDDDPLDFTKETPLKLFNKMLDELKLQHRKTSKLHNVHNMHFLFLFDNIEKLIKSREERDQMKTLIVTILEKLNQAQVLLTSTHQLIVQDFSEDVMEIEALSDEASRKLFEKKAGDIKLDIIKYVDPNSKATKYTRPILNSWKDDKLWKLLAGNPQAISIYGSLLADKKQSLRELVNKLESNPIQLIEEAGARSNCNKQLNALISTLHVATQGFLSNDSHSLKLFFMIGLLPDKIRMKELRKFWVLSRENDNLDSFVATLSKVNLIKVELVRKNGSETTDDDIIEMPPAVREYSKKLHSDGQRKVLMNQIITSHCDLMEHFYFNFDKSSKKKEEERDYQLYYAEQMLKEKSLMTSNLVNTCKLIRDKLLSGEYQKTEGQVESRQQLAPQLELNLKKKLTPKQLCQEQETRQLEKELKNSFDQAKFQAMQSFAEDGSNLKEYFLKSTRPDLINQLLDGIMEVYGQSKGSNSWLKFFLNEDQSASYASSQQHHYQPPCFRQSNNRLDDMSYKQGRLQTAKIITNALKNFIDAVRQHNDDQSYLEAQPRPLMELKRMAEALYLLQSHYLQEQNELNIQPEMIGEQKNNVKKIVKKLSANMAHGSFYGELPLPKLHKGKDGRERAMPLNIGEKFILYLLTNLGMIGRHNEIEKILKEELEIDEEESDVRGLWTHTFLANCFKIRAVYRLHALQKLQAKWSTLGDEQEEETKLQMAVIIDNLGKARQSFQEAKSAWGNALCLLLRSSILMQEKERDFEMIRNFLEMAISMFSEIKHLKGIALTQNLFYELIIVENRRLEKLRQLPFQKSSRMKDLQRAAEENMSYLKCKLDYSKFDNIEMLCTIERDSQQDSLWQIGYEVVLYSDVKYIFRAAEHYQPLMPDVFNRLTHETVDHETQQILEEENKVLMQAKQMQDPLKGEKKFSTGFRTYLKKASVAQDTNLDLMNAAAMGHTFNPKQQPPTLNLHQLDEKNEENRDSHRTLSSLSNQLSPQMKVASRTETYVPPLSPLQKQRKQSRGNIESQIMAKDKFQIDFLGNKTINNEKGGQGYQKSLRLNPIATTLQSPINTDAPRNLGGQNFVSPNSTGQGFQTTRQGSIFPSHNSPDPVRARPMLTSQQNDGAFGQSAQRQRPIQHPTPLQSRLRTPNNNGGSMPNSSMNQHVAVRNLGQPNFAESPGPQTRPSQLGQVTQFQMNNFADPTQQQQQQQQQQPGSGRPRPNLVNQIRRGTAQKNLSTEKKGGRPL